MVYIKKIEMYGFKSFADKTTIDLKDGITTVVGPNGSGKSNIVDAIRWVLGEQSIKSLRGAKSEDIIFSGTAFRKALGYAEVSLLIDNSTNIFNSEFDEIKITRRIYRDGESNYFINGAKCLLKNIQEIFLDTGLGKDGYSIIGQGRIDEILSNNSDDRRKVFEEAAGIVKYKIRKKDSEKKLEKTNINLTRTEDILSEISLNFSNLEKKSDNAKKYLKLREELKEIEYSLFSRSLKNIKSEKGKLNSNIIQISNSLENIEKNVFKLNEDKENLKKSLSLLDLKIEDLREKELVGERESENLKNNIILSKSIIEKNKENKDRYIKEIKENKENISKNIVEIESKQTREDSYALDLKKFEDEYKEKKEKLDNLLEDSSVKQRKLEEKKKILDINIDKIYELQNEENINKANILNFDKEKETLSKKRFDKVSEIDDLRVQLNNHLNSNREINNKKIKENEDLEKIENSILEKELENKKLLKKTAELETENNINMGRLNLLESLEEHNEGFAFGVKKILKEKKDSTNYGSLALGVISDILQVPKDLRIAIEMSLGYSMQNIVVKNKEDAKELINFLKDKKYGRASFLPIDTIKGNKLLNLNTNDSGYIGIASDLVNFDEEYRNIVEYLLGRVVISDDLTSAIRISKLNNGKIKIVTKDGDIINSSGLMTGGSNDKNKTNILGRKDEIKEVKKLISKNKIELESLNKKTDILKEEIKKLEKNKTKIINISNETNIEYVRFEETQKRLSENVSKLATELDELKLRDEKIKEEKEVLNNRNNEIKEILNKIKKEQEEIETEIENESDDENIELIDDLNEDIVNLKISISSFHDSIDSVVEMKDMFVNLKNDLENKNINLNNLILKLDNETKEKEKYILESEEKIKSKILDKRSSNEEYTKLIDEREQLNKKQEEKEKELLDENNKNIEIKEHKYKLESQVSKLEFEREQLIENMWNNYEVTQNDIPKIEEMELPKITDIEGRKQIKEIREKLKEIGSVDINAIEEFKETKERYEFLIEQKNDLEKSIFDLRKVITEMTSEMKKQFLESFGKINKNFQEVFSELFGGGTASIKLENEKDPLNSNIDINVQPPGKKVQNMLLLSGGERALTAIALLFGILKINPSPFCVLDEIEAALDDVNVNRFADYLKNYSQDIQFLVITHRKGTMESANTVYGITMEEKGISKMVSMTLDEVK